MVYVLDINGNPLMPTTRYGHVRRMLRDGMAKVVSTSPFTIQLTYESTKITQDINLGVDAGSKIIGLSATTKDKVLYEAQVELRNDIVDLISTRREQRKTRRNHKTRYRAPRFDNRRRAEDYLAPSVKQKVDCHLQVVANIHKILPISKIIAEVASFDMQKIKNPNIKGTEYQQGEQLDFWNVREYVLFRDNHTCQCCKGKRKDDILNVHHLESRKTGGNAPNNLICLCETCHRLLHQGLIKLPITIKRGIILKDAAFMGIMRWQFYNELKKTYKDVSLTYGYITKHTRITNNLPKDHHIDARCISQHPQAKSDGTYYYQKKVRCHNRQIHKFNIIKEGIRKLNQAPYEVKGFRLFDKVLYQGKVYFVFGRRQSGYFDIRDLSGNKVNKGSISFKKLKLLERAKHYLVERRTAIPPRPTEVVVSLP